MMDLQLPQIASSTAPGTSGASGTQSTPRPGQGGGKREAAGSGKSFSSELRDVRTAKEPRKESRHEIRRSQTDGDEHEFSTSSDDSSSTSTSSASSSAMRNGQAQDNTRDRAGDKAEDKAGDAPRRESDPAPAPSQIDVATQSIVLGLLAPSLRLDAPVPIPVSSDMDASPVMESVMPSVMEDGTSLPPAAADSSIEPFGEKPAPTAKPADPTRAVPTGGPVFAAGDPNQTSGTVPGQEATLTDQPQPTPEELRALQQNELDVPIAHEAQPQVFVKAEAKAEPGILQTDRPTQGSERQAASTPFVAQPSQRPEANRPVMAERPVLVPDAPEPKDDQSPRQLAAASTAWQESTNEQEESGMEWSGHDHRERPSGDPVPVAANMSEGSAPTRPSNPMPPVNGVDQRVFSSAPSDKVSAETHPTAPTPSVQPTDWMPGPSTNHTKSMMLELSQADLGRVNIRVAVNQDTVHTQFVSERNELGQYLMNGQDRLQSALNASGLDLGRFQVDIDRQSAGRSFQEPTSQGQSHGHTPGGDGQNSGPGRDEAARDTAPRRGMLNLVA